MGNYKIPGHCAFFSFFHFMAASTIAGSSGFLFMEAAVFSKTICSQFSLFS